MGLDMYLSVRTYVSRMNWTGNESHENEKFRELVSVVGMEDLLEEDGYTGGYVELPVYYWRKANAIHKWFVDELADGVDDCRPIEVGHEKLEELVTLCDKALADREDADEYLPTESGFFFGSTEYDEYYFLNLERTRDDLRDIIAKLKTRDPHGWLVYQASW
jgi:hypothetical protein